MVGKDTVDTDVHEEELEQLLERARIRRQVVAAEGVGVNAQTGVARAASQVRGTRTAPLLRFHELRIVRPKAVGVVGQRPQARCRQQRVVLRLGLDELNQWQLTPELSFEPRELGGIEALNE